MITGPWVNSLVASFMSDITVSLLTLTANIVV